MGDTHDYIAGARGQISELRDDYRLSEKDVSSATGASVRTVRRWRAHPSDERTSKYDEKIDYLCAAIDILGQKYEPRLIRVWLRTNSPYLAREQITPAELIASGRFEEAISIAHATVAGLPPGSVDPSGGLSASPLPPDPAPTEPAEDEQQEKATR